MFLIPSPEFYLVFFPYIITCNSTMKTSRYEGASFSQCKHNFFFHVTVNNCQRTGMTERKTLGLFCS